MGHSDRAGESIWDESDEETPEEKHSSGDDFEARRAALARAALAAGERWADSFRYGFNFLMILVLIFATWVAINGFEKAEKIGLVILPLVAITLIFNLSTKNVQFELNAATRFITTFTDDSIGKNEARQLVEDEWLKYYERE